MIEQCEELALVARLQALVEAAGVQRPARRFSELEAGADVKLSTLQRYCDVIGRRFRLVSGSERPDAAEYRS